MRIQNKPGLKRFFKLIYLKLFRIHDTPQRVAIGLGLGVGLGIMPATGPVAAIFLAFLFRVNRAAALLGCLLTNTWLSFVTLFFAIKLGSFILRVDWHEVYGKWLAFLKDFHLVNIFKLSVLEIIFPVILGYIVTGIILGLLTYLVALVIFTRIKSRRRPTRSLSAN